MKHSILASRSLVIAFAALLASAAFAGPPGKDDDGNSKRYTQRNKITALEKGYETDKLDIEFRGNSGTVRVKEAECDDCPVKVLRIVAATKAFDKGKEIPLARVASLDDRRGVVLTKPGSDDIVRILAF
jgi:hypothetical protein